MESLATMYARLDVPSITRIFNYSAEHAWVTSKYGNACNHLGPEFINNCNYDFAGHYLAAAFAAMDLPWNSTAGTYASKSLVTFSQAAFGAVPANNSLAKTGYVYVPVACTTAAAADSDSDSDSDSAAGTSECHLHVNFHGCTQAAAEVKEGYVSRTQLNEWAEANNIVVLYPQTSPEATGAANDPLNPLACWDIWGYDDKDYATKAGVQTSIVRRMVGALLGESEPWELQQLPARIGTHEYR
jgi:hypothetical protein